MSASYEEDLALIAEDIKRYAGADARIQEAVDQFVKLHTAEVEALAFEVLHLERELRVLGELPALPLTLQTCEICMTPTLGSRCDTHKAD